ncbi:hypothetical protein [Thermomonospora amylolytica]|uniref:hypothetical protein n=1 Tax=Thermomonospora amylolytica TaxID=1411117 RepID=UPI000E6CBF96|nr:hypothetical protein [Thermomonospora amylolytica]
MAETIDYGRFAERMRRAAAQGRPAFWTLLRDFQREWGYEEPGGEPARPRAREEQDVDEDRVDPALPIPAALREWWDLPFNSFTHSPKLYYTHPEWPPTIRPDPSGHGVGDGLPADNPFVGPGQDRRVCVFMAEYQYRDEWGYPAAEAAQPDPRVLVGTEDGWKLQARSISEFFLQLAVQRISHSHGWRLLLWPADVVEHPGLLERLRAAYPEMGLLPWRELGGDSIAYGAPDAIVHHARAGSPDHPVVVCARSRAALLRVARTLRIDVAPYMIEAPRYGPDRAERPELGPVALAEGDTDALDRWTVVAVRPADPAPVVPAAVGDVAGRTVAAADRDGMIAVTGDVGGGVHVSVDGAAPYALPLHDSPVTAVACVRLDGGPLVVSGDEKGAVRLWQPPARPAGRPIARHRGPVAALAAALLPTGPGVAMAWPDGLVRLRDVRTGVSADLWPGGGITALDLRPDGELRITAANGTTVLRLDPERLWPHRDMRLRLDRIDWASLEHSYGTADNIPDLIMKLATPRGHEVKEGFEGLEGALFGEVRACTAAAAVVPFLVELVTGPPTEARDHLFHLLSRIGRAHEEVDDGDTEALRAALAGRAAVEARIPALLAMLDHADPAVRAGAAYVLADFPDRAPELLPVLQARHPVETTASAAAALVLCVGDLYGERDDPPVDWLRGVLSGSPVREVRAAAALALLWCRVDEMPEGLVRAVEQEMAAGDSALDEVLWTFADGRDDLLVTAMEDHPDELIGLTRSLLATGEPAVRLRIARLAGAVMRTWRAAPVRLLPALAGLVGSDNEEIGRTALEEIECSGPAAARVADALVPFLDDERPWRSSGALRTLAGLGDARCLPALTRLLADRRMPADEMRCLAGLAGHAGELLPVLRTLLAAESGDWLTRLVNAIRPWGPRAAPLVPDLIALLERRRAVSATALTLGAVGEAAADAVPLLRPLLEGGRRQERRNAAWALWQITGDGEEPLTVLADTFLPALSESTAERLFDLGPAARPAVPLLRPLLDSAESADAAACVIYHATGDHALLPRVIETVAPTPIGLLAVRALRGPEAAPAVPRLKEIAHSPESRRHPPPPPRPSPSTPPTAPRPTKP